jgi:dinuclear metal center YbgI/SA1388 family protein
MNRDKLTSFLNDYLKTEEFNDYGPNGLQVEGVDEIRHVVTAVTASVQLFNKAIDLNADTIIVHHGIIWDFERRLFKGGYRERIRLLLQHNINLYAYHLPLDAHPEIGNNARICRLLKMGKLKPFGESKGQFTGMQGEIAPENKKSFFSRVSEVVEKKPLIFDYGPDMIRKIGVMTGGAQKYITQAVNYGLDVFITGEVSEHIMHYAQEEKIHFIAAGHYATEKFGITALGNLIKDKFNLRVSFIDIENPV